MLKDDNKNITSLYATHTNLYYFYNIIIITLIMNVSTLHLHMKLLNYVIIKLYIIGVYEIIINNPLN